MEIFRLVRELKALGADLKSGTEPRKDSLWGPEIELAVKAAQEDICANIDFYECQQPFHCKWHNRFSTDLERCPYAGQGKCDCHEYARALRTLVSHLNRRRPCARLPNRTARKP